MSGFDFDAIFARLEAADAERAKERGFASVDDMRAHDAEEKRRIDAVQAAAASRAHRIRVCSALHGRLRPEVATAIVDGAKLDETPALSAVREWLAGDRPVLILSGGTGAGKTVAAAWALAAREGAFQALKAVRLGSAWERWSSDREDGVEALRLNVATMLVDDLGQEPIEDRRTIPAVEELFDSRQTPNLRTIVTTNLSREQIRARYSERVISRLAQNARVIKVSGTDLRRGNR